jgi:hypothetical protein
MPCGTLQTCSFGRFQAARWDCSIFLAGLELARRRYWVACGGRPNGQYSDDAPDGSTTAEIFAAIDKARSKLDACMKSKGYEYQKTGS